jgi:CrcB protein
MLKNLLLVGLGGATGAMLRYIFYVLLFRFSATYFLPTMVVNVLGCFVMGYLLTVFANYEQFWQHKLLLLTGLLGGFTTFSAFGADFLNLVQQKQTYVALLYALVTNVFCIAAVFAGYKMAIS